jgi:hypothetical protein
MVDARWLRDLWSIFRKALLFILMLSMLGGSSLNLFGPADRIQRYADPYTFDFLGWTVDAVFDKATQVALGTSHFLEEQARTTLVRDYLDLIGRLQSKRGELEAAYGEPDPVRSAAGIERTGREIADLTVEADRLRPTVEAILQEQVASVLTELDLGLAGTIFPPVSFEFAQLPSSLIVSPRDVIRQDASISLRVNLSFEEKIALEERVEQYENVSALVVPVGGLGTYPTMILESTSLNWILEVIAHEWVHNYLAFRPLGVSYSVSPELRTMNETTASLIGLAVGRKVLVSYYPDLLPPPPSPSTDVQPPEPPAFDFRAEMRITRLRVDELLGQGAIEAAEDYMDQRRLFFWENGYQIRKLNQAYFAFHGAYADEPGGAAGDDPVGEAVRALWDRSPSLAQFLRTMAWMSSYEDLIETIDSPRRE